MRRGHDNKFLENTNGVFAISLGADDCAEHEWGVKDIRYAFKVNDDAVGLDKRKINAVPVSFTWVVEKAYSGIYFPNSSYGDPVRMEGDFDRKSGLYTAWSGRDFCALAKDAQNIDKLRQVYDAITNLDACIWLGEGGVFQNAGLTFGIISRMDKSVFDTWKAADEEKAKLTKDASATGIEDKLRKAGKRWFALSPQRGKNGSIKFYLNPADQHLNNYGLFTVKELEQWINGKGPVPKRK